MAKKTGLKIDGAAELGKLLQSLPEKLRKKAAREATRRAAELVFKQAKANIRRAEGAYRVTLKGGQTITRQPGELADAMIMTHVPEAKSYLSQHKVTFARKKHNDVWKIAHFIESGVNVHRVTSKNGQEYTHPGHRAYPFLKPAVSKNKAQIYRLIQDGIGEGMKDVLKKKK